jgi:integrase
METEEREQETSCPEAGTSTNGADTRDVRDRAILMLLAIYGLRSGEVRQWYPLDQI